MDAGKLKIGDKSVRVHECIVAIVLTAAPFQLTHAQASASPSFEVATIRESAPGETLHLSLKYLPNRLEIRDMTLHDLISIAYDLGYGTTDRVVGGPDWVRTQPFDVTAKEDEDLARQLHNLQEDHQGAANRQLIQDLLTERFSLKMHRESKVLTTYDLGIAKGPKLSHGFIDPHLPENIPQNRVNVRGIGWLETHNTDMALFVKVLGSQAEMDGRPVVDSTGLKDKYDFTLKWTPSTSPNGDASESLPSLFGALQEQLGLKLSTRKQAVGVVVIDTVDQPSAN